MCSLNDSGSALQEGRFEDDSCHILEVLNTKRGEGSQFQTLRVKAAALYSGGE